MCSHSPLQVSLFLVVRERLDLNELRAFRPGRVAWKRQLRLLRQRRKQRLRIHLMQGGTLENANVETLNSLKDLDDDELAELSAHEHKGAATLLKRVFVSAKDVMRCYESDKQRA